MKRFNVYHVLTLVLLTLLVYSRAVFNGFVYDDLVYLVGKDVYKKFDLAAMFTSMGNGIEYLPLRDLTLAIDYAMFGESPAWLHFSNLLYFLMTVIAVYYLVRELLVFAARDDEFDEREVGFISLLTASLFAVHPINGQAANFISARNVILGGLFFFLSSFFFIKFAAGENRKWGYYLLALGCFLCALLSKATVIILPAVLLAVILVNARQRLRNAGLLLPFFLLSSIFFAVYTKVGVQANIIKRNILSASSILDQERIATALQIPFFYLGNIFFPKAFTVAYDTSFSSQILSFPVILSITGLVLIAVLVLRLRRKLTVMPCCFLWYAISLVPVLNFFKTTPMVSDRYIFIPVIGVLLPVSVALVRSRKCKWGAVGVTVGVMSVVLFSVISFMRVPHWKSQKSLWEITVKNSPESSKAYWSLGTEYFEEGDYDKALKFYARSQELDPLNVVYFSGLGDYYSIKNELKLAKESYQKALMMNPQSIKALYGLGTLSMRSNQMDEARWYFKQVLDSPEGEHKLISETQKKLKILGTYHDAILANLRSKVASDPGNVKTRGDLALKLDWLGLYDEALQQYLIMEKSGMQGWQLFYNIANVYKKKKDYSTAVDYYNKSLAVNPSNPDAINNVGIAQRELGDFSHAIFSFEKAIALNRNFAYAPFNLALTYKQMGDRENAGRYFRLTMENFPELRERAKAEIAALSQARK